ncbi:hypothetical protein MXD81_17800, partial [Microbacteriaceae bacterium K1510]|nr:hypothetical protein [Microbacteriaceae bacterium K1510]
MLVYRHCHRLAAVGQAEGFMVGFAGRVCRLVGKSMGAGVRSASALILVGAVLAGCATMERLPPVPLSLAS